MAKCAGKTMHSPDFTADCGKTKHHKPHSYTSSLEQKVLKIIKICNNPWVDDDNRVTEMLSEIKGQAQSLLRELEEA